VVLEYVGVGKLHQSFFGEVEALAALQRALGACTEGSVKVQIRWDEERRVGSVVAWLDPRQAVCRPAPSGAGFDLRAVEPAGVALASYRDRVAAKYDFRVSSFRIGVAWLHGTSHCTLWAQGGFPPDGRAWSPCWDQAGVPVCTSALRDPGVVTLQVGAELAGYFRSCVGG
jgi:hypothetical protein